MPLRDIMELMHELDGSVQPTVPPEMQAKAKPFYLEPWEYREMAARDLWSHVATSDLARGALIRAAMVDEEYKVRRTAIMGLVQARAQGLVDILFAAALDEDESVRLLALECFVAFDLPSKESAVEFLANDPDESVAEFVSNFRQGKPLRYYYCELEKS